jgi:hypothetical protein
MRHREHVLVASRNGGGEPFLIWWNDAEGRWKHMESGALYNFHTGYSFRRVNNNWTFARPHSKLPWLKCSDCGEISYNDYLCSECRTRT